jgi:hypothetical protein
MARRKKMTVDEYIQNRDDITALGLAQGPDGYEIILRLDGTYYDLDVAKEQLAFVGKTLGIRVEKPTL